MARQRDNIDDIVGDENFVDEPKSQSAATKFPSTTKSVDETSSSSSKNNRKNESTNSKVIDTTVANVTDPAANSKFQSLEFFHIEKEINVLVKLRCSLKIDKNTKNYVDKSLTSVRCESTVEPSIDDHQKINNDEKFAAIADCHSRAKKNSSYPETISKIRQDSSDVCETTIDRSDRSNDDWKNLNLLTTTMMNFANEKLREKIHSENVEKSTIDRSKGTIRFSTPEVEKKYREILKKSDADNAKISKFDETTKNSNLPSSSRKRKFTSNFFFANPRLEANEEAEISRILGPVPSKNSRLFEGMSFVVTCSSRDHVDPHRLEIIESGGDAENEEQWCSVAFVRDRIVKQLEAGGGKFYEKFENLPMDKYETTKLITDVPNLTAMSLLCLSVGIRAYNHHWIIRCCRENKIVNPAEDELPAGWSLTKESYVEMFQRPSQKPFLSSLPVVVVIPMHTLKKKFITLWKRICENAGATVVLVEDPADNFVEGTVVLWHSLCPSWLMKKAKKWEIPVVSTRWAIQCLIEGQICSYDAHPSFDHDYVKKKFSDNFHM